MPTHVEPSARRRFDPLVAVVAGIALLVYALHGRTLRPAQVAVSKTT